MIEIRPLTTEEREKIAPEFCELSNSDFPPDQHSIFWGIFEDDELQGYVLAENVLFLGQIRVFNEKQGAKYAWGLVNHLRNDTPEDKRIAMVASEERFEPFFEHLGLSPIEGKLYRRG
jgi:hypothetical protein